MNIRKRLEIKALVNLFISIIERLVVLVDKFLPKKKNVLPEPDRINPHRPKPLRNIINIIPVPWRNK